LGVPQNLKQPKLWFEVKNKDYRASDSWSGHLDTFVERHSHSNLHLKRWWHIIFKGLQMNVYPFAILQMAMALAILSCANGQIIEVSQRKASNTHHRNQFLSHFSLTSPQQEPASLRRTQQNGNRGWGRRSKQGCVVVISHRQFEDHHVEDQPLECELQGEDLNGQAYKMVRVANRTTGWARKNNFESGESTIFATSGAEIIDGTGELIIPSGSTIEVSNAWFLFLD
jgi:hypothetical protein